MRAVEVQHEVTLYHLIHFACRTNGEMRCGRREHVVAETHCLALQAQQVEQGGEKVRLLQRGAVLSHEFAAWIVENEGNAEAPHEVTVFGAHTGHGVVGRDDEKGVAIPRHTARCFEKSAERQVGVGHALLNGERSLRQLPFVLFGHVERVVRTDGKFRQEEGLAERSGLSCDELQEGFVPNAPTAGIGITQIAVFVLAVVFVEAGFARKSVEAILSPKRV